MPKPGYNKGVVLGKLGNYFEAIEYYDKTLTINSERPKVWINKGAALGNLGRYADALVCFDRALEMDPEKI